MPGILFAFVDVGSGVDAVTGGSRRAKTDRGLDLMNNICSTVFICCILLSKIFYNSGYVRLGLLRMERWFNRISNNE